MEECRPACGGIYRVSPDGQVYGSRGRRVQGSPQSRGYLQTTGPGKTKYLMHRIVAEAWCAKPSADATEVNHKDKNRRNNHPSNLEWVTPAQNQVHKWACAF